jgi:hypothetical protein
MVVRHVGDKEGVSDIWGKVDYRIALFREVKVILSWYDVECCGWLESGDDWSV